jgi:hypothetical protein
MSSDIWTQCGGASNCQRFECEPWRVVEAQHQIATRKLVDSDEEQALLEELVEQVKPPPVAGDELHYLLATPFRYPPLRHGSRFGTAAQRGIWYGALELRTAFAEVAYYRLLLLDGTTVELAPLEVDLSVFQASVSTNRFVDLTAPPFASWQSLISSPIHYGESQPLGSRMRADGVEAFSFVSARDPGKGSNIGLFSPAAFSRREPTTPITWHCTAAAEGVELVRRDFFERSVIRFRRREFLVDDSLPSPCV